MQPPLQQFQHCGSRLGKLCRDLLQYILVSANINAYVLLYFISICGTIICGGGPRSHPPIALIITQKGRSTMIQKELNELRRRWRPEKNAVSRIYGCFVNSSKEIVSDLDESLGMMPQEEAEKYLSLLKKGLSGSLGKNLIDIVFSTQQVADSEEHRLLTTLRDSQLKDNEARQTFYRKVIDSLDMGNSSYLLLLACDSYDVPHRGKDDSLQSDASDEVFTYIVCVVCPIKEGKVELGYFPGDNEFHCAAGQTVAPPELGFLFPAFDDRAANIYNALFYTRKPSEIHQEFIDAVFHVEPPMSAAEQREVFESILEDTLGAGCSIEVAQAIHDQLSSQIREHKESKSTEPLIVTAGEIGKVLLACGVTEENVAAFQVQCGERFGVGAVLDPANLIDPGKYEVKTAQATIQVDPEFSYAVTTRVIDGRTYLLLPADDIQVNGLPIQVTNGQETETI